MTRLLFLAACFAGALATYDYGGGNNMAGNQMSPGMSGENMNKGADSANAMGMDSGDKYGAGMKNAEMKQNNAMEMKSGSGGAAADNSVVVLTSCKGGKAPVEQIAQPPMAKGMMHKVLVGGDAGLVFSPNTLTAMPGDMVEFTFMSKNHTLTQSTFPEPCKKMKDGVDSGFLPNPDDTISPPPTYVFQVKDAKPVWFYCKQKTPTSHCGKGMTFSINPTADKSHEKFTQLAIQQNGTAPAPAPAPAGSPTTTSMPMPPPASSVPPPPPAQAAASSGSPPPEPSPSSPAPAPVAEMPPAANPASAPAPATPAQLSAPPAAPANNNKNNNNNMIAGSGTMANGQCSCSCLCGVGAFPAGAGVGMYGGFGGSVGGM
ncbi:MAG: hypothetical protein LQ339_003984 [Xanthoria mediterranea]|nr:MAG: hypothetical protein LQ339_003984 [Xanthoria mediterranea]